VRTVLYKLDVNFIHVHALCQGMCGPLPNLNEDERVPEPEKEDKRESKAAEGREGAGSRRR